MTKIVINRCYGGFGLSQAALARLRSEGVEVREDGFDSEPLYLDDRFPRHDPRLVAVVEEMGKAAWGQCSRLCVADVERGYRITERDGMESVEELGGDWVVVP